MAMDAPLRTSMVSAVIATLGPAPGPNRLVTMAPFPEMEKRPAWMLTPGTSPWRSAVCDPANVWIPGGAIKDLPVPVMVTSSVTRMLTWPPFGAGAPGRRAWNEMPGNSVASVISSRPLRMLISLPSTIAPPVMWISPSFAKPSTLWHRQASLHQARPRSQCLQHHPARIRNPQAAAQMARPRSPFPPPLTVFCRRVLVAGS